MSKFGVPASPVGAPPKGGPSSTASTPFSTSDGRAKVTDGASAKGFDPLKNPRGNPQPGGQRNVVTESRSQRQPSGKAPPVASDAAAQSRRQQPTTPQARLGGQQNMPVDGSPADSLPMNLTPAYRRDTAGSVGATHKPFRFTK
jgi:hypothetical protein